MVIAKYTVQGLKEEDKETCHCDEFDLVAHKKSCPFCEHCYDIIWDYSSGPYMFLCELGISDAKIILLMGCDKFVLNSTP